MEAALSGGFLTIVRWARCQKSGPHPTLKGRRSQTAPCRSFSTSRINRKVLQQGKRASISLSHARREGHGHLPLLGEHQSQLLEPRLLVEDEGSGGGHHGGESRSCIPSSFLTAMHTPSLSTRLPRTEHRFSYLSDRKIQLYIRIGTSILAVRCK